MSGNFVFSTKEKTCANLQSQALSPQPLSSRTLPEVSRIFTNQPPRAKRAIKKNNQVPLEQSSMNHELLSKTHSGITKRESNIAVKTMKRSKEQDTCEPNPCASMIFIKLAKENESKNGTKPKRPFVIKALLLATKTVKSRKQLRAKPQNESRKKLPAQNATKSLSRSKMAIMVRKKNAKVLKTEPATKAVEGDTIKDIGKANKNNVKKTTTITNSPQNWT
ncbi:hypothetical protein BY458DRAFT_487131 [Sporodiniella umbellata]|nr:hypothetical protein BY458DRAFT_487131 [Sporodiniella umbellata]